MIEISTSTKRKCRFQKVIVLSIVVSLEFPKVCLASPGAGDVHQPSTRNAWANVLHKRFIAPWKTFSLESSRRINSSSLARANSNEKLGSSSSFNHDHAEHREDEDEEDGPEKKESKRTSVASAVLGIVQSIIQNDRFRRIASNSLQFCLVIYIAQVVWQSASEVMEEFSSMGGDSLLCRPEKVEQLISFLEQDPSVVQEQLLKYESNPDGKKLPAAELLLLTRKLLLTGMPLRRTQEGSSASIESLLRTLTRQEASLLTLCLWTPNVPFLDETQVRDSWNNIAGLESVKVRLLDSVAHIRKSKTSSTVVPEHSFGALFEESGSTGGILLFGPPGCGKTMLIKALAQTTRLPCLILTPSVFLRKYVGESNMQVRSLFSLTKKLGLCVLCLDELDGLFRERRSSEHEVSRDVKTEFLQWWDGILSTTNKENRVLVIGATNRPFDVDPAVLRRLPQSYFIGLPDMAARTGLLQQLLDKIPVEPNIDTAAIAARTEGYSPSDLRQLLQTAAMSGPLRESRLLSPGRSLKASDIMLALQSVNPTPLNEEYRRALTKFADRESRQLQRGDGNAWSTSHWGTFYDAGTIELEHGKSDQLTDIANEMEDFIDDHNSNNDEDDSDFEL